jgi:phosphopantothenoylcysteine decarboxylase/phosphopantothenate--cysteine ligase
MGIALAAAAKRRGADVTLILGPSAVPPPIGVATNHVETAAQLQWALANAAKAADAIVMTAAVADYRPAREAKEKLKRGDLGAKTTIELVANPDLLAELGKQRKGSSPLLVGFAAETEDVIENARKKLAQKKCDLIVANNVAEPNAGFAVDTNHVQLVDADDVVDVPPAPKSEVAHRILDKIAEMLGEPAAARSVPAKKAIAAKTKKRR